MHTMEYNIKGETKRHGADLGEETPGSCFTALSRVTVVHIRNVRCYVRFGKEMVIQRKNCEQHTACDARKRITY